MDEDDDYRFRMREMPISVGKRVLFTRASTIRHDLSLRPLLYILELEPTLFDRAAVAIARDSRASCLAHAGLPIGMRDNLMANRILTEDERSYWIVADQESDEEDNSGGDSPGEAAEEITSEDEETYRASYAALRAKLRWIATAEDEDVDEYMRRFEMGGNEDDDEDENSDDDGDDGDDDEEEDAGSNGDNATDREDSDNDDSKDIDDSFGHDDDSVVEDTKDDDDMFIWKKVDRLSQLASRVVNRLAESGSIIW